MQYINPATWFSEEASVLAGWSAEILQKSSYTGGCFALSLAIAKILQRQNVQASLAVGLGAMCLYNGQFLGRCKVLGDVGRHIAEEDRLNSALKQREKEIEELNKRLEELISGFTKVGDADKDAIEKFLPRLESTKKRVSKTENLLVQLQSAFALHAAQEAQRNNTLQKEKKATEERMAAIVRLHTAAEEQSASLRTELDLVRKQSEETAKLIEQYTEENNRLKTLIEKAHRLPQETASAMKSHKEAMERLSKQLEEKKS